jgi:hypothetical protein
VWRRCTYAGGQRHAAQWGGDPNCTYGGLASTLRGRELTDGGVYLNFAGLGEEDDLLARAAYGRNYDRLVDVKRRYDPANLFRTNVNIAP